MKTRIKSLLLIMTALVATLMFSSMVFAAPAKVTGLKQTGGSDTRVDISWDAQLGVYYEVQASTDNVNWVVMEDGTSAADEAIYNLSAGKSVYIRVRAFEAKYSWSDDKTFGEFSDVFEAVTEPDDVTGIVQTNATTSSASFKWNAVSGATSYKVYKRVNGIWTLAGTTNTNSITISGLSNKTTFDIEVISVRKRVAFEAVSYGTVLYSSYINLIPAKVSVVEINDYYDASKKVWVDCGKVEFADGYQYQAYTYNGKKPVYTAKSAYSWHTVGSIKANRFYKIRVRAYTTVNGSVKYGAWSDYKYCAQEVKVTPKYVGSKKLKLSWKKVKGATKYTVYMSTSKNSGYKKVGTTKKTSYTVKKFKKKKISRKKTYYVYVVASRKVGKTTYKSNAEHCYYLY